MAETRKQSVQAQPKEPVKAPPKKPAQGQRKKPAKLQQQSGKQQAKPTQPDQNDSEAKERQRKEETSKAAKKALEAQKQAKELTQAAAAAGDPEERQKLLNQALEKEVEAETFGKTAKYLQSGTFQGLCAGAGMGGSIGVWLGFVTGTLVGGTTSLVTGGLGAGIGAVTGALHGPWFKVGDLMGGTIRKITGDIPGWEATEEQKGALEKMVNGVREQDTPDENELLSMSEEGGKVKPGQGFTGVKDGERGEKGVLQGDKGALKRAVNPMSSSQPNKKKAESESKSKVQASVGQNTQPDAETRERYANLSGQAVSSDPQARRQSTRVKKPPRKLEVRGQKSEST